MENEFSPLHRERLKYRPLVPLQLKDLSRVVLREVKETPAEGMKKSFPRTYRQGSYRLEKGKGEKGRLKIGVVFSGGQAAGGHNVISGLFDAIQGEVIGFLDGPSGIVANKWKKIESVDEVRNQGGFDLIGSGRTKIETEEQFQGALKSCQSHKLDGLVIIGGDDSNTNAALLAEYFLEKGCDTRVIGVPKTIDGDLRSKDIEISFGFDTACKIYSEMIGNIARDALSAKKYYHFIKLMGRSASHITLECALATHPNLTLIGEEGKGVDQVVNEIADLVIRRKEAGKEYGVILVPEGLIEFMPEFKKLIGELNGILASQKQVEGNLSKESDALFKKLPEKIQKQLVLDRDPHGNVQVSLIATEQLLIEWVKRELKRRNFSGKFSAQDHFMGYEGRAGLPSNFDANYCYALGRLAALCIRDRLTGMICSVQKLEKPPEKWEVKAVPIVQLIWFEERKGKQKAVIRKTLVDIKGKVFVYFSRFRKAWEIEDRYRYPGPIQFFGEKEITDSIPISLMVSNHERQLSKKSKRSGNSSRTVP